MAVHLSQRADVVPDLSWTSGRSELGKISCSRVPRHWSACPRRRIPFFRNRRGYCCTNARVERSFMLAGLAGQAASTGSRIGSCCCICCESAFSVGGARWSGPLELLQCLPTALLHCTSASRQLLYTVCRCLQTAPLHCLSASRQLLSLGRCVTLLHPILLASTRFVGERGGE